MWGRTLAFIIIFILVFGALLAWIPDSFSPGATVQDSETFEAITAANLVVYQNQGADNMTEGYDSYDDGPDPPNWNVSLAEGHYISVLWTYSALHGYWYITLTHYESTWYGGKSVVDLMTFYYADGSAADEDDVFPWGLGLTKANLETAWSDSTNSSAFTAKCDHSAISIIFKPDNGYTDIGEAFDEGYLWYGLSYGWNTDQSGFNVMSVVINLLTFHGIGIGIPGILGNFLDSLLSAFFWIAIIIVAYVVITAVIPFISGAPDT